MIEKNIKLFLVRFENIWFDIIYKSKKMKKYFKSQQLRLPLIEQCNQPLFSKYSKDSTKRSNITSKNSYDIRSKQKQKNFNKLSNFMPIKQNNSLLQNRSLDQKELSKSMGKTSCEQTLTDFQQKIKQNKILLKKYQLQKLIQKQQSSINHKVDTKQNSKIQSPIKQQSSLSELDKLPQSNSKKLLSHLNSKINLQLRQSEQINKSQLKVITQDDVMLQETLNKRKNHLLRLNKKIKSDDIFENIHILLQGLQADNLAEKSYMQKKKIYNKILKYKQRLQKQQPNSQLLQFLNIPLDKKQSLPFLPKVNNDFQYKDRTLLKTKSPWQRIVINKTQINKLSSSFDQQIDKVDFYLNKSSVYLDQLLKNKIQVLDLLLMNKIKEKKRNMKS